MVVAYPCFVWVASSVLGCLGNVLAHGLIYIDGMRGVQPDLDKGLLLHDKACFLGVNSLVGSVGPIGCVGIAIMLEASTRLRTWF